MGILRIVSLMNRNIRIGIFSLLGLFGIATIARAGSLKNWFSDETNQKILQLGTYGLIDYDQTADALYSGGNRYKEINPILGEHPERKDLAAFGIAGVGIIYLAKEILPKNWTKAKEILVDSALSTEQFNIEENQRVQAGQKRQMNAIPIILNFRW
jgi:hypothetical protein